MQTNEKTRQWFKQAKLGLFVHWGLYSMLGRGEWVMLRDGIPPDEYARLADRFNPRSFDIGTWCLAAKKAGMKYVVFTTKHHDGFALFDSQVDPFNSVRTAAGRDFVAEFAEACRSYDLGVGFYFSLGDWRFGIPGVSDTPEGARHMVELAHQQVQELMTGYGKVDILWYDGAWRYPVEHPTPPGATAEFWQAEKLNAMVRKHQGGILINNRSGRVEDFGTPEGQTIIRPPKDCELWEACMTMGDDDFSYWGYKHHQTVCRTPEQTVMMVLHVLEHGGNIMLNVGPDGDGVIPPWQQQNLEAVGHWMADHAEAVYGTEATQVARRTVRSHQGNSCSFFVVKDGTYYLYLYEWPGREFVIPYLEVSVNRVEVLKTGQVLPHHTDEAGALHVGGLPVSPLDRYCTVLKMTVD